MSKVLNKHRESVLNVYADLRFYSINSNVAGQATPFAGTHRSALRRMFSKSEQSGFCAMIRCAIVMLVLKQKPCLAFNLWKDGLDGLAMRINQHVA